MFPNTPNSGIIQRWNTDILPLKKKSKWREKNNQEGGRTLLPCKKMFANNRMLAILKDGIGTFYHLKKVCPKLKKKEGRGGPTFLTKIVKKTKKLSKY